MSRNHPFEGPEVFDDEPQLESLDDVDPWPTVTAALRELVAARAEKF